MQQLTRNPTSTRLSVSQIRITCHVLLVVSTGTGWACTRSCVESNQRAREYRTHGVRRAGKRRAATEQPVRQRVPCTWHAASRQEEGSYRAASAPESIVHMACGEQARGGQLQSSQRAREYRAHGMRRAGTRDIKIFYKKLLYACITFAS